MSETPRSAGLPRERLDIRTGWQLAKAQSRGLARGAEIALGVPGQRPIPDSEPLGSFGGRRLPRGIAIGSDGRIYIADPYQRVIRTAIASDGSDPRPADGLRGWPFAPLWPARPLPVENPHDLEPPSNPPTDPYVLVRPVAVALAPNGDLVIADAGQDGAGRVLVMALTSAQLRHVIPLGEPVAISFDASGRCAVADAGAGTIVRFDRFWRRDPDYPHTSVPPIGGLAHIAHQRHASFCQCGCGAGCGCGTPEAPRPDLWFIADGRLHALTENGLLWTRGKLAPMGQTLPTAALPEDAVLGPPPLQLSAEGKLSWKDPAYPSRAPLPLPYLSVDRAGRLKGSAEANPDPDTETEPPDPVLVLIARLQHIELPRSGRAQFNGLDGGREGFAWDRITFDADVPERTRMLVSTLTTDTPLEPSQLESQPDTAWSAPLELKTDEPAECLVQSGGGRYLWIRLELFGDGTLTPVVRSMDVSGPRRSSLHDLPAPFHEDAESADFLDRFLSYFDTVFAEITDTHSRAASMLDPAAAASSFLDWLASWFDITFLPEWPEAVRRDMVARAIDMYRSRGTIGGLTQMLRWHTGTGAAVIEHFRLAGPISVAGAPLAPSGAAHAFTIAVPAAVVPDDKARRRLEQIIKAAVPAHTRYDLRLVSPGIAVGRQSTLGVDMLVGSIVPGPFGEAMLGDDTMFAGPTTFRTPPVSQGVPFSC